MKKLKYFGILSSLLLLTALFQNCGEGFNSIGSNSSSGTSKAITSGIEVLTQPKTYLNANFTEITFSTRYFKGGEVVSIQCSYNSAEFEECESPILMTALQEGQHTVDIQVLNSNSETDTQSVSWLVDLTPAMVAISSGPSQQTYEKTASFVFVVTDLGAGIEKTECSLNNSIPVACTSPQAYTGLVDGNYVLQLIATDKAGNVQTDNYSWLVETPPPGTQIIVAENFVESAGVAINTAGTQAFVVDKGTIVQVDLATGQKKVVSSDTVGVGPVFRVIRRISLNADATVAFVIDSLLDDIFKVDLLTGNRSIVVQTVGNLVLADMRGLALNADATIAYVADNQQNLIVRVDLATGERTIVSGGATGVGPALGGVQGLAVVGNQGFVIDDGLKSIVRVDLATGQRTAVAGSAVVNGKTFTPQNISLNANATQAVVTDFFTETLYKVDLATGQITSIDNPAGVGSNFSPKDIFLNADASRAFMVDQALKTLVSVWL